MIKQLSGCHYPYKSSKDVFFLINLYYEPVSAPLTPLNLVNMNFEFFIEPKVALYKDFAYILHNGKILY